MAVKIGDMGAHKTFKYLPVESPLRIPSRPSKFRVFLIRSFHLLFTLALLFSLHAWYSGRFAAKVLKSDHELFVKFRDLKYDVLNSAHAERIFLQVPDEESAIAASRAYATLPHLAGSDQDFITAKYVLDIIQQSFGIEPPSTEPIFDAGTPESRDSTLNIPHTTDPRAWIDTYYPVLNTPLDRSLQILDHQGSPVWSATLEEDGDPLDEDSANARTSVPVFHGLSKGGDVTGELFYANYGRQEDYDQVEKAGVNITGKIALVRYGGIFRGLKIKGAQERGAIGTIIYSDPRDDGSVRTMNGYKPYPYGPARNPTSVQRGSVQFISMYPGDPTTPGYPSYKDAIRTEGTNIPRIPSLPISWDTAKVLLREIYKDGEGCKVRLVNKVDDNVTPIWNTMMVIPGHIKSEVVLLGNHRDAWVLGGADPSSGTASTHELIRGLGALYRTGWRPLRTIVLASWDAEEYGLIGSTEWGEDFSTWITEHVVAYINVDTSVSGSRFGVAASPSLAHLLKHAALDLPHPTKENHTLWDATSDRGEFTGPTDPELSAMTEADAQRNSNDLGVTPLGSGSDFTVFLQRLGIASTTTGFGATLTDAVYHYHSIYDSHRFQEIYADPGFHRHVAVSKHLGLVLLRLADSIILPMNTTYYAEELVSYVKTVEETASNLQLELDLSSLRKAVRKLHKASRLLDIEKVAAEKRLRHIIKRLRHKHRHGHHHGHHAVHEGHHRHHAHNGGHHRKGFGHRCRSGWKRVSRWIKNVFGAVDNHRGVGSTRADFGTTQGAHVDPTEEIGHFRHPHHPPLRHHHRCRCPSKKLIKAVKRVQRVNKKLSSFEHGFISIDGIADREWYKHLGVAPGKWLGYGATTLPALTEALTIEKNATLAKHEAQRLTKLLTELTTTLLG